jgi:hypothetical protein
MSAVTVKEQEVVLSVGDTTFLDYRQIVVKREGYGPIGKAGNGLILHSALAIDPEHGQPLGLLWQKLWNREPKPKPPANETPRQKKRRQGLERKAARKRAFEQKESYRWVEALETVNKQVGASTRVLHVFDREGDIAEVFEQARQLEQIGIIVRAAHDRSLDTNSERLWAKLEAQPIQFYQAIELPKTDTQTARTAKVAVRFCPVSLRVPYRFEHRDPLQVYAVYACEVDCPDGATPLSWMLLTTEAVTTIEMATTILRWYSYRWRVEINQPQCPHKHVDFYADVA